MNNEILKKLVDENEVIMMDTCFAMQDEFPEFVESIEIELMTQKKKIVIKSCVLAELYRKMGSNDDNIKYKATRAIETICLMRKIFDIDEERVSAETILKAFADVEFISDFTINRIKYRMALLTNDYKLGKDINDLNNLESCYGHKVGVFALNKYGYLEERKYDTKEIDMEIDTEGVKMPMETDEKDDSKNNTSSIILTVITSFVAGIVVDRYGKRIWDTVVKVVAHMPVFVVALYLLSHEQVHLLHNSLLFFRG